ncbi:hypothetical protein Tco_0540562 [Tanacetum coccineum]
MSLDSFEEQIQGRRAPVSRVSICEPSSGITRTLHVVEGKGKGIATDAIVAKSLLELQVPKKKSVRYIVPAGYIISPVPLDVSTSPSAQLEDDTSSHGDNEILRVKDEQGDELASYTELMDEDQAGSDPRRRYGVLARPNLEPKHEDQAGPDPRQSHGSQTGPNPYPMHDDFMETLDDTFTFVPVHQASTSVSYLSTPVIDLATSKPVPSTDQEPAATTTTTTTTLPLPPPPPTQSSTDSDLVARVSSLEKKYVEFEKKNKTLENTTQNLGSRVFNLEIRDLPHKIDQTVNEVVKENVQTALHAPLKDRFRVLTEALEASMDRDHIDEFLAKKVTSHKRHRDDQDPLQPLPKNLYQTKMRRHDSDASEATSSSSKQKNVPQSEQPIDDIPIHDEAHLSDPEETGDAHLLKTKPRPEWLRPIPEEDKPKTPEPDWGIPPSDTPKVENNWADAITSSLVELVRSLWIKIEREYDIAAAYGISHWWFKRKEFYITRHRAPSGHKAVRSHMRILSVISLKTYSRSVPASSTRQAQPSFWLQKSSSVQRSQHLDQEHDFIFKEDYTIIHKLRAVIYKDMNNQKRMMRETKIHKFSNATLTRILERLDNMVKDF